MHMPPFLLCRKPGVTLVLKLFAVIATTRPVCIMQPCDPATFPGGRVATISGFVDQVADAIIKQR